MHGVHDLAHLDLNLVVALDALLAERHVTRAARRLALSQSATSHALARLRRTLDDPLLVRGAAGELLRTPRAEALAPLVTRALVDLTLALRGEATFAPATAQRRVRIAASDYAEAAVVPTLVARLAAAAPGIELVLRPVPPDATARLATGDLDLVLAPPRSDEFGAGIRRRTLFDETLVVAMRKGHPLARARLTLPRFCAAAHLLVAPRGTPGSFVDDALAARGRSRRVAVTLSNFLTAPAILAASDLVATLPRRVVQGRAELVQRPAPLPLPGFALAMLWHERAEHDAGHAWLRRELAAAVAIA